MRTTGDENLTEKTFNPDKKSAAQFTRFSLRNDHGEKTRIFKNSEEIIFEVEYEVYRPLTNDHMWMLLERADGLLIIKAADDDGGNVLPVNREPGRYKTTIHFPGNIINEGVYQFRIAFGKRRGVYHDDKVGFSFEVEDWNNYSDSSFGKRNGTLLFPLKWKEQNLP